MGLILAFIAACYHYQGGAGKGRSVNYEGLSSASPSPWWRSAVAGPTTPARERIVDGAPVFVLTTGILTVVLAVPATIFNVLHYRRMKHHKTMADGPREALAWQLLATPA